MAGRVVHYVTTEADSSFAEHCCINMRKVKISPIIISIALYGLSLALPAWYELRSDMKSEPAPACMVLLVGWLGVPLGYIEWLANPLLITSWVAFPFKETRMLSRFGAALAALVASLFLLRHEIMINEAGHMAPIVKVGSGYILWIFSMLVVVVAPIPNRKPDTPESAA